MDKDKKAILIADDAELNRTLLRCVFEEEFTVYEAEDGEETIKLLDAYHDQLALVLLDLVMPKKTGLEVMKYMVEKSYSERIPVIMITGEATTDSDLMAYEYGISDVIYKPFSSRIVKKRAENVIELYESRADIERKLEKRTKQLNESRAKLASANEFLINALSSVVEFRSSESGEHIMRVKYFTRVFLNILNKYYPEYNLTKEQINLIVNASALHDLGKIAIPDNILLKPGKLTPDEYEEMKKHSEYGCQILERFKQDDNEFYQYCYDICRHHHERYDGKGYPDGLVGEEIPIWAQVVSIVDVYDALVSKRVYKGAYETTVAFDMIKNGECGTFSPKMLDCLDLAKSVLIELTDSMPYADFTSMDNSIGVKV